IAMNTWRAGCGGSRTSGSEGGPGKPTSRKADRAPRSDPYTEHATAEGKLYLCAIKDIYSNRIVGYSIDSRMKASLAVAALRNAVALRAPAPGLIVHSDRGSQFRSNSYLRTLKTHQLRGSMGRVGACGDNAAMESFFALLQKNVPDRQRQLGKLTPIEFETIQPAAHAA
ncbi:DDE-type integrase/transposase/recombinase, partial [Streptomyces sp. SID13031]|uniref:DDE-type integrase/transposase/recombinase n=1 Tax=Streptomyces sp. SID13031 TaxID=2706046 RepID=UPI001EF31EFF